MKNLPVLNQAICEAYDRGLLPAGAPGSWAPTATETFCNRAVRFVGNRMGYHDWDQPIKGLEWHADDMVADMRNRPSVWKWTNIKDAQFLANMGTWVVAALDSHQLKQAHGHVVTIRPGEMVSCGKWNCEVPVCLNIGAEVFLAYAKRGPAQGLPVGINEAFGPMPEFYALAATL